MGKIEAEIQAKVDAAVGSHPSVQAIGDMILAEMGIGQNSAENLGLKPQFSSDFMSFSEIQKEIDQKCLRQPSTTIS